MNSLRYLSTLLGSAPARATRRLSKAKRRHHQLSQSQQVQSSHSPDSAYPVPAPPPPPPPSVSVALPAEESDSLLEKKDGIDKENTLPAIDVHPPPSNNSNASLSPSSLSSSNAPLLAAKDTDMLSPPSPVASVTPSSSSPLLNLIYYCFRRLLALVGLCAVKPSSARLAVSSHASIDTHSVQSSHTSPLRWFSIIRPALSRKRSASDASLSLFRHVESTPNSNNTSVHLSTVMQDSDRSPTPSPSLKPSISSQSSRAALSLLSRPKVLVLDLDETLIHSTSRLGGLPGVASGSWRGTGLKVRVVEVVFEGKSVVYHVYKRPWVDFFLRKVASWYNVVVFTASMQEYADPVIDWLDQGHGLIGRRLFRESCVQYKGSYIKNLEQVEPDLSRVCLVDNSPASYCQNPANGIPIEGWINDANDEALLDLLPVLDSLRFTTDVRHVLGLRAFGINKSSAPSFNTVSSRRR